MTHEPTQEPSILPGPMTDTQLAEVWSDGASRATWTRVLERATEEGDDSSITVARRTLDGLPHPLVALEANTELVTRLVGGRWHVILNALEGDATWEQVAEALHCTVDQARDYYRRAIDRQERYCPDLTDIARARAVLEDQDDVDTDAACAAETEATA